MHRHITIPDVHPHRDPLAVGLQRPFQQGGIPDGGRAEDDPVQPFLQIPPDRFHLPDAAAHLAEEPRLPLQPENQLQVRRAAVPGALQIHQMDMGRAGSGEFRPDFLRMLAVYGHLPVVALQQPDRLSLVQVNGRKYDHFASFSVSQNALRMASPVFPLFSGWNWHPRMFAFPTQAVRKAPYSVSASRLSPQPVAA